MQRQNLLALAQLGAGFGLILSAFAAYEFLNPSASAVCSFNAFFSCAAVNKSGFTSTFGIPDWAWGFGGFVILLGFSIQAGRDPFPLWRRLLFGFATLGLAFSAYFLYVELAQIHALCVVCASSYVADLVVWVAAAGLLGTPPTVEGPGEGNADGEPSAAASRP